MRVLSPEIIWQMNDKELISLLNGKPSVCRKIHFYAPSFMYYKTRYYCSSPKDFPTISVTGKGCVLKCKHCGGKVLETMYPATSSEKLFELCRKLKQNSALGCLISGGCSPDGSVPLEKFVNTIKRIKRELELTVFVHTGIISSDMARKLKDAGVDAALIDVIGSDETLREIYNLDVKTEDYEKSLEALNRVGMIFVPHVIVGLHYGELKGEFQALKIISRHQPSAIVIIAFMPIHGTEMEKIKPPTPTSIAKVIVMARLMFPKIPVVLGCMRPKGKERDEIDILAIKAGVDAMAFPAESAIKFAEENGYEISFSSFCCARMYADFLT